MGAAIGYLAVVAFFNVPIKSWLWWHCRRAWHDKPETAE
jgi:hypothetical protein